MSPRKHFNEFVSHMKLRPFSALREKWREGYSWRDLQADALAGAVVGLVAIPLSMALAIASGVPPQYGLYTAMVAGFMTALLGGSRFQVTGPTAAFVVILAPVVHRFGFAGLLVAGFMAGILLLVMGAARMGRLIQFIPHPVTTGFTTGIAVVIATLQIKDFMGLQTGPLPEHFLAKTGALMSALPTFSPIELGIGALTLVILIAWPKLNRRIPAPLAALSIATGTAIVVHRFFPGLEAATVGNRFSTVVNGVAVRGIPGVLPPFQFPWSFPGAGGNAFRLNWHTLESLFPPAFAIAMLGAIESLLSAVVADGMGRTRHDPDAELIALGQSNLLCPFFGAIPATGAIARTATNIRYGARSPFAAMFHALFILAVILFLAPTISLLPMAALAALMLMVAYNMAEIRNVRFILNVAPRSDRLVLVTCFALTVVFDMVIGVGVGIVLAALLFMRRMAQLTSGRVLAEGRHAPALKTLPKDVLVYEIGGPLFFGAAEQAMEALRETGDKSRAVVLWMESVPVMDISGLVAFESLLNELHRQGKKAILVGVQRQPMGLMKKADLHISGKMEFVATMEEAVERVKILV